MRKVFLLTTALLLVWSCSKDDASESFVDQESKNEFFTFQPDNEHVKLMYDYLKNTPEQFDALQEKLLGTPHWSREVSYTSNGKPMYVIPLADFKNKEVNAILLLCAETEKLKYRLFINDEDAYPAKGFDWVFEYFKQELFQINQKYKFENTHGQKKDGVNTKATMEICNDIWAGNDTAGWIYKGQHCWSIDLPDNSFDDPRESDGGHEPFIGDISNPLGGGSSGSPSTAPPVNTSTEFKKSKAGCVQERLMLETSFINNLTKEFVPVNSTLKLRFEIGYIPYSNGLRVNGRTYSNRSPRNPYDNTILIKVNEQILNESPLKIATVLAHEIIHAEIFRWVEKSNWKPSNIEESYPELWQEFLLSGKKLEIAQHELMTKKYVEDLANLLKWFDKGRHSDAEYSAMSWMGLHKTSAFKSQDATKIKDLQKKISNEKGDCDDI